MSQQHDLVFDSIVWMDPWNPTASLSEIYTNCVYYHPTSCADARKLMLKAVKTLLDALNADETLKPYLIEYPFPARRLNLTLLFRKHSYFVGDVPFHDETMESVVLNENTLVYYYYPNSEHNTAIYVTESLQEAQYQLENPSSPSQGAAKGMRELKYALSSFFDFTQLMIGIMVYFIFAYGGIVLIPILIFICLKYCFFAKNRE